MNIHFFFQKNKLLTVGPKSGLKGQSGISYRPNAKSRSTGIRIGKAGLFLLCLSIAGCGTPRFVPQETRVETVTNYVDSVRWNVKDSVVYIPRSVIADYGGYLDTLRLESEQATATAWLDTARAIINGRLEDKEVLKTESHIEYRVQYVERVDTLVCFKEVGVPYEVVKFKTPRWCYYCLAFSLLCLLGIALKLKP